MEPTSVNPALRFMPMFFVVCGAILVISGIAQALVSQRPPNESKLARWLSRPYLKMVMFVTVGVLGILVGVGVIPIPHLRLN
jgi:hypothetical protein